MNERLRRKAGGSSPPTEERGERAKVPLLTLAPIHEQLKTVGYTRFLLTTQDPVRSLGDNDRRATALSILHTGRYTKIRLLAGAHFAL